MARRGGELREPEMGFEPMTYHLRGGCSTTELLRPGRHCTNGGWREERGWRPGGLAHRAARRTPPASVMMLAVTDTIEGPIRRVMVGTDRSQTAERAVRWAAGFAERFEADLYVVQVIVPEHPADTEHGAAEATRARATADELHRYVFELAAERGHGKVVVDDDPAMAIVHATEDEGIDVLVVGNAGMSGRKEFLLGNVPNRVSHNTRRTVVIVNTAAALDPPKKRFWQ